MSDHPNAERARLGFEAFQRGDFAPIAELIHEDATWTIGGRNAMADTYRGRDAIFAMLRRSAELTGGTYRVEPKWVVADDDHVVAVYRARGERDGRTIDIDQALLVRVDDGRWVEIDAVPTDQHAFDEFWA